MCKAKRYKRIPNTRIDECMVHMIRTLNQATEGSLLILGCCCGHGKYPMTIVAKSKRGNIFEMFSNIDIPRVKRFYKRDKQGYYFIPEVKQGGKNNG